MENFSNLADIFLKAVKDEDYRVRIQMSKLITVFFELFADEEAILKDINKHLPITSDSIEYKISALLTLGEIAIVSNGNTKFILFQLCQLMVTDHGPMIVLIIENISKSLAFPSVRALMEHYLDFLIGKS